MAKKLRLPYKEFESRKLTDYEKDLIRKLYKFLNVRAIAYILQLSEIQIANFIRNNKIKKKTNIEDMYEFISDLPIIVIDKRKNYKEDLNEK